MKTCSRCGDPLTSANAYRSQRRCGLQSICKKCERQYQRERRLNAGMQPRTQRRRQHRCTAKCSRRFGFCIAARNERRWAEYKRNKPQAQQWNGRIVVVRTLSARVGERG